MKKLTRYILILGMIALTALLLTACGGNAAEATQCPEPEACPECEECPEPEVDTGPEVPFLEAWQSSGHADIEAEAFRHWDEEDPAAIPADCARCHSTHGYRDYVGADGTAFGSVEAENFPTDSTVECVACHNSATLALTSVMMPSGAEITGLGAEARCMQCHQGRESGLSVAAAVDGMDEDTVNEELGFINVHYFAAAATKYGTLANGGYQYEGKTYDGNFAHVEEFNTCNECHNPHTLEVQVAACANCHEGVETVEDLHDVRMVGSAVDYDGDGDIEEGIYYEIEGLSAQLYSAIQTYAADAGTPLVYDSAAYPYFFVDTDGNGETSEDEAIYDNAYNAWTPRLLKAAYNFQVVQKDPGGFAHGGKYLIQLLVDSIEDLGSDVSGFARIDHGHFAGSEEAFRHWDEDGEVSASCAKCHSAEGLPFFLEVGASMPQEPSNGFQCTTCHNPEEFPARREVSSVTFPSGLTVSSEEPQDYFLCISCHQGRESTTSVDAAIAEAGVADNAVSTDLGFINVHYFAAGATKYGTEAKGGYEFAGKEYNGYFPHLADAVETCTDCHDAHELEIDTNMCADCHGTEDLTTIRMTTQGDFDGDGDDTEGIAMEIAGLKEILWTSIQDYTVANDLPELVDLGHYPYFSGVDGSYESWTPNLLRAVYNYQYVSKDPGAFAHNGVYILQLLYDSIQAVGGNMSGLVRP